MNLGVTPAQPFRSRAGIGLLAAGLLGAGGALFIPAQAQETVIAYEVPADTVGNQDFSGMLGMDFDVANPVIVKRVGVFDSGSDGLNRVIYAGLWNRETQTEMLFVEFRPDDPGELVGGSRFKALPEPIRLEAGFQGTITADGYGPDEPLLNSQGAEANMVWTTNDGNGSLQFVGTSRYGVTLGAFPDNPDGGPAARYAAGTFEDETTPALLPGHPENLIITPGDQAIALSWSSVLQPAPAASYRVLRGTQATGPFTQIAEVTETEHADSSLVNGTVYFYVVRAVTAGGLAGPDSALRSAAPYAPLRLEAGFRGVIQANGYGAGELSADSDIVTACRVLKRGFETAQPTVVNWGQSVPCNVIGGWLRPLNFVLVQ